MSAACFTQNLASYKPVAVSRTSSAGPSRDNASATAAVSQRCIADFERKFPESLIDFIEIFLDLVDFSPVSTYSETRANVSAA